MAIKANPFFDGKGGRFTDVVHQNPERQGIGQFPSQLEHQAGMNKNISFRMKLRRLLDAIHGDCLRQDLLENS